MGSSRPAIAQEVAGRSRTLLYVEHSLANLVTRSAPGGRPQPLCLNDGRLYVGCWDDKAIYAIDVASWTVAERIETPGIPYGIAFFDRAFHVVVSVNEDDDRYIYRFASGSPVREEARIPCPDLTGSHLTTDGHSLYLVQQTHRQMLELGPDGSIVRTIPFTTRCAGAAFTGGIFYMITADKEFDVLEFATLDLNREGATPQIVAAMDVDARGLATDGAAWWTCYRERNLIASFTA